MGKRGPSAQYAYGITIEAGDYKKVISEFKKEASGLESSLIAASEAAKLVTGSLNDPKNKNAKQQFEQLSRSLGRFIEFEDKIGGDNIQKVFQTFIDLKSKIDDSGASLEQLVSVVDGLISKSGKVDILGNFGKNDIKSVLQSQLTELSKTLESVNTKTGKAKDTAVKQAENMAAQVMQIWSNAEKQGIDMSKVIDSQSLGTVLKTVRNDAKGLGQEFAGVKKIILDALNPMYQKHAQVFPSGFASKEIASLEQRKDSLKAIINLTKDIKSQDLGLKEKSKELEEFLNKLENPKITKKINGDIFDAYDALTDRLDNILGDKSLTPKFVSSLNIKQLKELGDVLSNIVAMGEKYKSELGLDIDLGTGDFSDQSTGELEAFRKDLDIIINEIRSQLDEIKGQVHEASANLREEIEKFGLKDIELDVKLIDLTDDKINAYVSQLNSFVEKLIGSSNKIELPVELDIPGITPNKKNTEGIKSSIASEITEFNKIASDLSNTQGKVDDAKNKAVANIIEKSLSENNSLNVYLEYIRTQFQKIRTTIEKQKKETQKLLTLDFTWNQNDASSSFNQLFIDLQEYFADPENRIKVEIDDEYLKQRITSVFKDSSNTPITLSTSNTPMDQAQLAAVIISGLKGALQGGIKVGSVVPNNTQLPSATNSNNIGSKSRYVFDINNFQNKYSSELSSALNETLDSIVDSIREIAKTASSTRTGKQARASVQAVFESAAGGTIATDANTASKLKNAIQSSEASKAVQEEAIKRTISVDALGEETVALEINTKAKLKNALASSGMDKSTIGNVIGNVIGGNASLDLSEVANMTDDKIREWVQEALLQADSTGRALGSDIQDALKNTKVTWSSIKKFTNSLNQLFIMAGVDNKGVQEAEKERQKLDVLKDAGYRSRAIKSKSTVITKLNKGEVNSEFLEEELKKLESVQTYKETLSKGGQSKFLPYLDKLIDIYKNLININNGTTTFDTEEKKQEEINRLRDELIKIRTSEDANYIKLFKGEISIAKKGKNGAVGRGSTKSFGGSTNKLDKVLSFIENAGGDGVITIRFDVTPNDTQIPEWIISEGEGGKSINSRRRSKDNNVRGESKSSLISPKENISPLIEREVDFEPFEKVPRPVDWGKYEADLQKRLQENKEAIDRQKEIVAQAEKKLESADKNVKSAKRKTSDSYYKDSESDKIVQEYEQKRNRLQSRINKIDEQLAEISQKKDNTKHYSEEDMRLMGLQVKASDYYDNTSYLRNELKKAKTEKEQNNINDLLTSPNKKNTQNFLSLTKEITQFIEEVNSKISSLPKDALSEKNNLLQILRDAQTMLTQVRSVQSGGDTPIFRTSKESISFAEQSNNEYQLLTQKEDDLLKRKANLEKKIAEIDSTDSGAAMLEQRQEYLSLLEREKELKKEIVRLDNAGISSEEKRNELADVQNKIKKTPNNILTKEDKVRRAQGGLLEAQSQKNIAQQNLDNQVGVLQALEAEQESLILEQSQKKEKKSLNNLLIQQLNLIEQITELKKQGLSTDEKEAELAKVQAKISKKEDGNGVISNLPKYATTKEGAITAAVEYDAQEKLVSSQIKAIEAKIERQQAIIDDLTERGFNSAKGAAEYGKFKTQKIQEFKSSSAYRAATDQIRDYYLKNTYKDDGTLENESELSKRTGLLVEEFKERIGNLFFEITDANEKDIDEFFKQFRGDVAKYTDDSEIEKLPEVQKQLAYAFKGSDVGKEFMSKYEESRSLVWDMIKEEESNLIKQYADSIKADMHNGTVTYTSYENDEIKEVIVNLKDIIVGRLKEQIQNELQPLLDSKNAQLSEISTSKQKALDYGGYTQSDIRNYNVDNKITEIEQKIASKRESLAKRNAALEALGQQNLTNLTQIEEELDETKRQLERNSKTQKNSKDKLQKLKKSTISSIEQNGINTDEKESILLQKIEQIEENISQKKERQKKIQEELTALRSQENKDLDAISKKELQLERIANQIKNLEDKTRKPLSDLNQLREGKIAFEAFKNSEKEKYLSSEDYQSKYQKIVNEEQSLLKNKVTEILDKYRDVIYDIFANSSKYEEEDIEGFLSFVEKNPDVYQDKESYFKIKNNKYRDMAKYLSNSKERVWSDLVRDYQSQKESSDSKIDSRANELINNYMSSFIVDSVKNMLVYTSYDSGSAKQVSMNLTDALLSIINKQIEDILSGVKIESESSLLANARSVYFQESNGNALQQKIQALEARKLNIENLINNGQLDEDGLKQADKLQKEKVAIESEIAALEEEAKAWEFVKQAKEEARELDKKTDEEKELTLASKLERQEEGIARKKERQKEIQEELNNLRGQENKDLDAIERKESDLEKITKQIEKAESDKQKTQGYLDQVRERIANAPQQGEYIASDGGILSPIVSILTEIRDILSNISNTPVKDKSVSADTNIKPSNKKITSEINQKLNKYWWKHNDQSYTSEQWKQLQEDYLAGKLKDFDVASEEAVEEVKKEAKKSSKKSSKKSKDKKETVVKEIDEKEEKQTKKESNRSTYAGGLTYSELKEKIKQTASKVDNNLTSEQYLKQAQELYNEIDNWTGEYNIQYFAKRHQLSQIKEKAASAARKENPDVKRTNLEWYKYWDENGVLKNDLALNSRMLGNNKEIMQALVDKKTVDTTPVKKAVEDNDSAIVESATETAQVVKKEVKKKSSKSKKQNTKKQSQEDLLNSVTEDDRRAAIEAVIKNTQKTAIKGKTAKSNASDIVETADGLEYLSDTSVKSFAKFKEAIYNLTDSIEKGENVANVEYGYSQRNRKKLEMAVGTSSGVAFGNVSGKIDSITHSHAYQSGISDLIFSKADIDQMKTLAQNNNLKKYNLLYGKGMMSLDLGESPEKAAEEIASKYPKVYDIIAAMFADENGKIPPEATQQFEQYINGWLKRCVSDLGGKLTFSDGAQQSKISDEIYNQINTQLANSFSKKKSKTVNKQLYDYYASMPLDQLLAEAESLGVGKSGSSNIEKKIKATLTKKQQEALNPDINSARQKQSIKDFSKTIKWNDNNISDLTSVLGQSSDIVKLYNKELQDLRNIADEIRQKGEQGLVVTNADLDRLDEANNKVKQMQKEMVLAAQKQKLTDEGRLFGEGSDIGKQNSPMSRRDLIEQYAKQYASSKNGIYNFSNYEAVQDKLSFSVVDAQGQVTKSTMQWIDELNSVVLTVDKTYAALDRVSQKIVDIDNVIKQAKDNNFINDNDVSDYNKALEAYNNAVKDVTENKDPQLLDGKIKQLQAAQEALLKAGKEVLDKEKSAYGYNAANKTVGRESDIDTLLKENFGSSADSSQAVQKYKDAIAELKAELQKVNENGSAWSEDSQSKLKMLSDNADKAERELLGLVDASKKLNEGKLISDAPMFKGVDSRDAQDAKNAMEAYAKSIKGVQLETIRYDEAQKQVTFSVRTGKNEISDMVVRAGQLDNQFRTLTTSTRYVDTGITKFAKSLKSKFLEVGRYLASFGSIYRIWGEIRQGVQYVRDIDTALTELKKVTDETDETYSRFLKNMGNTASVVGSTTSDLTKSAADWARLGYSIQEAGELAKNTSILMNVSEFDDVNKATDTLISALQAFKKDGTDVGDFSMEIIDKFNEVGNNYAISTSDLADSLTRSSAALVAAGNTLEESIAMTTAANTIIQNPENVGNALKVLSMRIRGVKSELEDAGEETDGVVTNTSKLNDQVMALTASANNGKGISLINDDGSFRSTYEILLDISKIWDKMDSMSQASLLEKIAGKTRGSVVAALLQSPEVLEDAFNSATNAAGSATNELNTYLDSIEGRISLLTNAVQTMWTKWLDSNAIKFVVDLGTSLVNLGEKLNLFGTILTVIGGKFILTKLVIPQIVKALNAMKTSVAQATAEAAGETIATDTNTASKLKNAIQSSGASKAVQEEAIKRTLSVDALGAETVALEANTKAKLANALASSGMDESTIGNIIGNVIGGNANNVGNVVSNIIDDVDLDDTGSMWANWINGAEDVSDVAGDAVESIDEIGDAAVSTGGKLSKIGGAFKKLGSQIKAFSTTTLGVITIFALFAAATVAIIDIATVSFEEAKDTLKGTTDELNDTQSNIKSLNGELEDTEQRIAELQSKGKLSFVESEELKKLQDQNDELQRSIYLEEQKEKRLQEQQAKDAQAVYDRDLRFQPVTATYHGKTDTISEGYVDAIARVAKDQEKYDKAKEKYEKEIESNSSDKKIKAAEKEMERTKEICETSKEYLSQTISDLGETYGDLTWQYGEDLEDWQKQINTILKSVYDAQDQSEIALANANGSASEIANAYNNAFKRVSRQTDFEDELKQIQEEADITSDKLREMLSFDSNGLVDASAGGMSEFIQSLIDCGFISDTSADSLQKVIDASIMLGDCTSDAAIANKKLAKSQKTLQYYKQSKELHDYIKKIKDSDRSLKDLTDEERNYINAMTDKLKLLSEEISRYDILGDQINEAKEAFDNFENAKQSDSDSDLLDSTSEMFKSIIDGFQSAELGSDTFRAALQGLVPESVYKDLDTLEEKYDAIWNYVNEDLKSYFTVEYNDDGVISGVEITSQNVEDFIQDAKDKGLLSFTDGVWKVNENDFGNFAKDMNITKSFLVAIGTQMDKMDADWINGDLTSFFDSFGMDTESNILKTVNAMAALDQQLINSDGTDNEKLKEYTESYKKLQDEMRQNGQNAVKDIETYTELTNNVEECQKAVDDATAKLNNLRNSGGSADEISVATTELDGAIAKLGLAINKKGDLTKPSQVVIECAVESIEEQKKEIEAQLKTIDATIELTTTDKDGNEQINSSIIKQLDDGTYAISVDANIPDESKEKIQEYIDLLNQEVTINQYVETDQDAQEYVDTLQKTYENLAQVIDDLPNPDINTSKAMNNVNSLKTATENLKKALDNLPSEVTTTVTTVNKTVYETETKSSTGSWFSKLFKFYDGNAHFDGAAYANGTLGAKQSGVSLTGELGPELLIRGDEWRTIGENGAEFVNVKKGDIIFNHKQTEELIKNGHINSRGKAYASGTAYDGGTSGTIFNKYANISAYGQSSSSNNSNSTDSLSDAAETIKDAADEFKEVFDWFEVLLKEVDSDLDLMAAKLENAVSLSEKDKIYKQILSANNYKMNELYNGIKLYEDKATSYLKEIPNQYREMAKNGAVKITDFVGEGNEEVVEAIQNYREWAEKVQDLNKQLEETKKIIADTRVEQQQQAKTNYDNEISLISAKNDRIQESIDLLKEEGKQVSPLMYEEMAKNSKKELSKLQSAKTKMQAELDSAVKSGDVKKYSSQWYEMVNAINAVDGEINNCKTDIEGFQNSINDLHWENFDKLMQQINNVSEEAENVRSLISEEDSFNDVGEWTGEGITSLGMLITEMENAQYQSQLYGKEIAQLEKDFKQGKYSQDEYNEKLKELQDKQWGSIKAYESSKKELVSLNKARVQAVKDGMQKEIDAYEKLINKQKESLSAQKDAHDWNKQVADQQKEIAKIQRQIDAMAGDNSAAAVAKRAQLYEELYELQDELAESFYDHDIEMQQKALDDSLEAYKTDKEDKMEALDEYLKEEDQVISDSFDLVKLNADVVGQTLKDISKEYGVDFSDTLVNPWKDGASAIGEYNDSLDASQSTYSDYLKNLKKLSDNIQSQSNKEASDILDDINKNANDMTNASYEPPKPKQDDKKKDEKKSTNSKPAKGETVTVDASATRWARDGGNGTRMDSWVPGSSFTVYQVDGQQALIGRNGQYTGWINIKDLKGYAKGTIGVKNSQLAKIDEQLEELVLHADGNGRLAYLTKGTSVIPGDLTKNLMQWGALNPQSFLDQNRPKIGAPHITSNNVELNLEFGALVHVDNCNNDTIPELQKMVKNEFDTMMKQVNKGLKRYTR